MQQLKQNCHYYTLFLAALSKDTRQRLNPSDIPPEDDTPAVVEDGLDLQNAGTIEGVLQIGNNDFTEGKDYTLIELLMKNSYVVNNVK